MKADVYTHGAPLREGVAAASSLAPPGPVSIERLSQYHPGSWGLERRKADAKCISPMELHAGRLWMAAHCTGVSTCGYIAGPQISVALVVPRPPGESWAASAAWMRTAGRIKSDRPCPWGSQPVPRPLRVVPCKQTSHVGDAGRSTVQTN